METQIRKTKIPEAADMLAKMNFPSVSSQSDNVIEIQLNRDLMETFEAIIGPMGWTAEEYIQAVVDIFANFIIDPLNKEKVAALVDQWRSEGLLSSEEE